jgi:molecular chaperone DnaJ
MATTGRDYYEVLGVGRTATDADIKRAFRRLARELHPDVSAAPDADERFKEVVEAYEVLSKSETRQLYDRFGHAGLRSGGFRPTAFDFGSLADIFSAFFGDDVFGVATGTATLAWSRHRARRSRSTSRRRRRASREVPVQVAMRCAQCGGDGVEPGTPVSACEDCGGTGRIQQVTRTALGEFIRASRARAAAERAHRRASVRGLLRRGAHARGASPRRRVPPGSTTGSASGSRAKARRRARRQAGDVYVLVQSAARAARA